MQKQQNQEASSHEGTSADAFGGSIAQSTSRINSAIHDGPSSELTQSASCYNYNEAVLQDDCDTDTVRFSSATNSGITSPAGHLFRTQSPYRRALRKSMRVQDRSSSIKPVNLRYLSSLSALSLPTRRSSPDGSERDVRLSSAESIYSNLSDSLQKDKNPESAYDLSEFDTIVSRSPQPQERATTTADGLESSHQRQVSTASSVEWKTWLSAKVSKLEDCGQASRVLSEEHTWNPWSTLGHVRENAEIEPNSNQSDTSAAENGSIHTSGVATADIPVPPLTQSIVIEDGSTHHSHPLLTHDENAPPEYQNKKTENMESKTQANIRSVSSLPNVRAIEAYETTCKMSVTPQKQQSSPSALTESPSRTKKAYFNSGAASSLKSSPGLSAAVRRQFGTVAMGSPRRRSIRGGEDVVQSKTVREAAPFDDCRFRRGLDAQAMGSKRMVELFLNSRKTKRVPDAVTSDWAAAFI
ncbi:hypothetical protein ISF_04608 [Cordyceps fumosorosea ARSEF 2679]|uniref:Uncharacterized protein n=1 Tax=Cordyceps fumosorosea (strain ARSEF 2679) TaxID=1081104 RepID=A0A167WKB8_CORFA|nr:hypothetical protein ISF_04608 [Cordyceps fumosorosea ARSEF 2679]OAA63899.1 hypothetical protein ISF_04608 [Cordyceps fumosorosea ARSEF 2679]